MKDRTKNNGQTKDTEKKGLEAMELSDDALEKVSGGGWNWWHGDYEGEYDPYSMFDQKYDDDSGY